MTACILWAGAIGTNGYGKFNNKYAHRLVAVKAGIILNYKDPRNINHKCHNKLCVNPEHLYAGDQIDNGKDMVDAGRDRNQNKDKMICIHGHPFTPENTYWRLNTRNRKPHRECRICMKNRTKAKSNELVKPTSRRY